MVYTNIEQKAVAYCAAAMDQRVTVKTEPVDPAGNDTGSAADVLPPLSQFEVTPQTPVVDEDSSELLLSELQWTPCKRSDMEDLLGDVYIISSTPGNKEHTPADLVAMEVELYKQEAVVVLT